MDDDEIEIWNGFCAKVNEQLGENPNIEILRWRNLFEVYSWGYSAAMNVMRDMVNSANPQAN